MKVTFKSARDALSFVRGRSTAYRSTFLSPSGQQVLASLAEICHAHSTTFAAEGTEAARRAGKREVWLHIQGQLRLTDAQLYHIASGGYMPPAETEDDDP